MKQLILSIFMAMGLMGTATAQNPPIVKLPYIQQFETVENDTLYILNFWATWCKPCVAEMPYFEKVQQEFADQKVKLIFVSMDFAKDYETRLLPFIKKKRPQASIVLLDEPKYHLWMDKISTEWSGAIPATLFLKHSSGIRHFHEGEFGYDELKSLVLLLLK